MKKRITTVLIISVISVLSFGLVNKHTTEATPQVQHQQVVTLPAELKGIDVDVNNVRIQHGLKPLKLSAALDRSATVKAQDMVARNYWEHNTPDGKTPWTFLNQQHISYLKAGENLARCYDNVGDAVSGWVNSPKHYANIVGDYNSFGFGYAVQPDGCISIVNHFAKVK